MHLEKLSQQAENVPNAAVGAVLLEGIHYYLENGRWVFTELYHFQRGYCCRSGCRHCIYGFKKSAL
ncbi:MAG: DUF5522 domain-containing protein [Bernardetiaceae bacterium]|nr:DUF5522 domain-containing protein [Bernardetiaceae bacterium]